jgi:hypothetical protein
MTPVAREELDKCYALMGTKPDPFRVVWTEATIRDRNLFCHVAGVPPILAKHPWDNLSAEFRELIHRRVRDLRAYLNDKAGALDATATR